MKISNTQSFLLALLSYFIVVAFVFFKIIVFKEPSIKYTDLKDSFIDIEFAKPSKQIVSKEKNIKQTQTQALNIPKIQQETTNQAVKTEEIKQEETNFNALFGNVKEIQEEKTTKIQSSAQSFFENTVTKNTANNLLRQLEDSLITEKAMSEGSATQSQRTGIYDEFLGKITRIIEQRWRLYHPYEGNLRVVVKIFIDSNGKFGYTSVEKSYNAAFDEKVLNFLQNQKGKFIANPPRGELVNITMNLGDEVAVSQ